MKTDKPAKRTPVFVYGLVIGLLVGVLLSIGFVIGLFFNSKNSDELEKDSVKIYKSKSNKKSNKNSTKNMSAGSYQEGNDSLNYENNSTYGYDSINDFEANDNDAIRVVQEQLIYVRYILPSGNKSNFYCQSKDLDSLLIDNPPLNKDGRFKVEFWVSPVNYVGYKLTSNKLILYGFMEFDEIQLEYNTSGGLKMKYLNNEYRLQCTDDFVSLYIKKQSKS